MLKLATIVSLIATILLLGCDEERGFNRNALSRVDSVEVRDAGAFYSVTVRAGTESKVVNCNKPLVGFNNDDCLQLAVGDSLTAVYVYDQNGKQIRFVRETP